MDVLIDEYMLKVKVYVYKGGRWCHVLYLVVAFLLVLKAKRALFLLEKDRERMLLWQRNHSGQNRTQWLEKYKHFTEDTGQDLVPYVNYMFHFKINAFNHFYHFVAWMY